MQPQGGRGGHASGPARPPLRDCSAPPRSLTACWSTSARTPSSTRALKKRSTRCSPDSTPPCSATGRSATARRSLRRHARARARRCGARLLPANRSVPRRRFNAPLTAHGAAQTGAGKTFTMSGDARNYAHRGLIPRVLHHIFREVDMRVDRIYKVQVRPPPHAQRSRISTPLQPFPPSRTRA